jgi:hypothetical protein
MFDSNAVVLSVVATAANGETRKAGNVVFANGRCRASKALLQAFPRGTKSYEMVLRFARSVALEPACCGVTSEPTRAGITIDVFASEVPASAIVF